MQQAYYTYRICITDDCKSVQANKLSPTNTELGIATGKFLFGKNKKKIEEKLQLVINNQIDLKSTRNLGEILFNSLFDATLAQDFLNFRYEVVRKEGQLLRVELDIDESKNPHIVVLPWEFLRIPQYLNQGTAWLATDSNLVFSRRRKSWNPALPIQLQPSEKLRIGLAIASPKDLGTILYGDIEKELGELAEKLPEQIELLPIVKNANALAINDLLEQKPHIFHFIGHGQLDNEQGKIALENKMGTALWVDAESFSELFNVHHPAVVLLQACEGGMSSNSEAFVSVAAKIVSQAIPVVVAMQYQVSNITATSFAEEFYKELGKGEPIDIAVQRGRNQVYLLDVQFPGRDFATPVLFMNARDGYLFYRDEVYSGVNSNLTDIKSRDNYEQDSTLGIGNCSINSTMASSISYTTNHYYTEKTEKDLKDPKRVNNLSTEDETQKENFKQVIYRRPFNDSMRKYLVDQIMYYYGSDQIRLMNIFTLNQDIFGKNFYGNIVGDSFNSKIVNLVDELIKKNKVENFIKIVREEFCNFANS